MHSLWIAKNIHLRAVLSYFQYIMLVTQVIIGKTNVHHRFLCMFVLPGEILSSIYKYLSICVVFRYSIDKPVDKPPMNNMVVTFSKTI
uniref:Uncharacterized protein n=1 Tax=Anguilla anguilla TaxID=7936 RepID=A0A0E9QZX4_ANGAN